MYYEIFEKLCSSKGEKPGTVSKATGIPTATLTSWKQGKYTPKQDKLQLIADHFDVTIDFLMGNTDTIICPECDIYYNPLNEESVNLHTTVHDKYENAIKKYGFCYTIDECGILEQEAISALSNSGSGYLTLKRLKEYYLQYLKSDFSYLLRKRHFNNIPFETFGEYAKCKIQNDMHSGFMTHDLLLSLAEEFDVDLNTLHENNKKQESTLRPGINIVDKEGNVKNFDMNSIIYSIMESVSKMPPEQQKMVNNMVGGNNEHKKVIYVDNPHNRKISENKDSEEIIDGHFTNVDEALAYIKQETSLVAAFDGKTDKEDVILQIANAIYMDRTKK